jgi:hypothetical protein
MATLLAAVIFAGFVPTFFARGAFAVLPPLPVLALLHGLAGTLWLLLFVTQAWLIAADRRDWHRRLGPWGAALAALFVASAAGVITNVERGHFYDSLGTLAAHAYANGAPTLAFGMLVALGIAQRRVAARHKRFMLFAAIALLPPGTGRLFGFFGVAFLNVPVYFGVLLLSAVYDALVYRRIHPLSWIGAAALVAIEISTDEWLDAIGS